MKVLSRVVWSEGMHLAQHHFQTQNHYFEDAGAFALDSLFPWPYGLLGCELDADALLNGTVDLVHARGIMPDGLTFQFPEDPPPEPLAIRDRFSPTHDSHRVLLAIPAHRPNEANCDLNGPPAGARYVAAVQHVRDEITGQDEKPVQVARKNFRLLLDGEDAEGLVTLPIARIRRDGSGRFVYDDAFVPPSLQIAASERLLRLLRSLTEILEAKADTLRSDRLREAGPASAFSAGELASFWLSHALHSGLAALRHHLRLPSAHPERVYLDLARLAGALATFSLQASATDVPAYDHDDPGPGFDVLERLIRAHGEVVLPTQRFVVPLRQSDPSLFTGEVRDRRCFGKAQWYLGVRGSAPGPELADRVPKLVKICSAKHIVRLVKEAYPGVGVEHVAAPPSAIGPRAATQYFLVHRTNPCWKSMVDTGEIGIYVPASIPDAEIELVIALEE